MATQYIPLSYWFEPTHNSYIPTICFCYVDVYKKHMLPYLMDNLHAVNMKSLLNMLGLVMHCVKKISH